MTSREILLKLQEQENHYESVRKIYSKFSKLFQNISVTSGSLSVLLSGVGLGTSFLIIIGGVPLVSTGLFCGILSVSTGLYSKRLNKKISKHEQTATIAKSKINSIQSEISKVLSDGKLSEEFSRIQKEAETYKNMKLEIRKSQS